MWMTFAACCFPVRPCRLFELRGCDVDQCRFTNCRFIRCRLENFRLWGRGVRILRSLQFATAGLFLSPGGVSKLQAIRRSVFRCGAPRHRLSTCGCTLYKLSWKQMEKLSAAIQRFFRSLFRRVCFFLSGAGGKPPCPGGSFPRETRG